MDEDGNFDLLGEEFEFLSLPNYWVFKERLKAIGSRQSSRRTDKSSGNRTRVRNPGIQFCSQELNQDILNDIIENDLKEETVVKRESLNKREIEDTRYTHNLRK